MSSVIKVSFEITDNWNLTDFRNYIKYLLSLEDKFEVFIISNDDSSTYINAVGQSLSMDSDNVVICNFTDDKVSAITDNQIDIHFDNLQSFVMLVDETTDAYGVLVTKNLNKFYLKSDYVITFENLVERILKDRNEL